MSQPSKANTGALYIGLMSGTSMDGIDTVLVNFDNDTPVTVDQVVIPIPKQLRQHLQQLCHPGTNEITLLGECDRELGELFAHAALDLLERNQLSAKDIVAIGSHGQTIRHSPTSKRPFSLQIGDPNTIAYITGINTVADFRRRDIAAGGEGAPLVPAFHKAVFSHPTEARAVINIGGIANITWLQPGEPTRGLDTGPGNGLLDAWIGKHKQEPYDANGDWARQGKINKHLALALKSDAYFDLVAPKSTGKEYFNLVWLEEYIRQSATPIAPVDVQATLVDLTAWSIAKEIKHLAKKAHYSAFVCGGGHQNELLMTTLQHYIDPMPLQTTAALGINPDWVEAIAFAWLAKQTLHHLPGNEPDVTGAQKPVILGGIYPA